MEEIKRTYRVNGIEQTISELTDDELRTCMGHGGLSMPSVKEMAELRRRGFGPTRDELTKMFI